MLLLRPVPLLALLLLAGAASSSPCPVGAPCAGTPDPDSLGSLISSTEPDISDSPSITLEPRGPGDVTTSSEPDISVIPSSSPGPAATDPSTDLTEPVTISSPPITDTPSASPGGKPVGESCFAASECAGELACFGGSCGLARQEFDLCQWPGECASGLSCKTPLHTEGGPPSFTCVRVVGEGAACNAAARLVWPPASPQCDRQLACAGGTCKPAAGLGDACVETSLCEHETACAGGVCKVVIPQSGGCDKPLTVCRPGTVCNNFPGKIAPRECVTPKKAGEWCSSRYICQKGGGVQCVRFVENKENDFVPGYAKQGTCLSVLGVGEGCQGVANSTCADGLGCIGGACGKKAGLPFVEILPDRV